MSLSLLVRKATPADSDAISALHCRHISWGLLTELGQRFVSTFYHALICSKGGFAFVAEQHGQLVGFASGVTDWRRFYWEFLRRHLFPAIHALAANFRGRRWRRLFETTSYAAAPSLPSAELVSIALEPAARGTGTANRLVHHILEEFAARGVHAVRVTFGSHNAPAKILYEQLGFRFHSQVEIHSGQRSAIYVISLPTGSLQQVPSSP